MADDRHDHIRSGVEPAPAHQVPSALGSREAPPDILLWKPSLAILLVSGVVAGAVLGAANGLLCYSIVGAFESPAAAGLWGAGLGGVGGISVVLLRRAMWGPDIGVEVGTLLGLLYGIAPGLAVLFQSILVNRVVRVWGLAGLVFAGSMAGFIIGGVLDRITEAIVARMKRSRAEPFAAPDRGCS
jgi:hypothetical protein